METLKILLGSFGACAFFAMLFHSPRQCVLPASLIGTAGYAAYLLGTACLSSPVAGAFADALVIAVLSEIMARRLKAPATLFASVGLIPVVPGGGLYNTMHALMQGDYPAAANYGVETVLIAGSLALAVALVSSAVRARK